MDRDATPSAAMIDSQSVQTDEKGAARLRCWQAYKRTQTSYSGGYEWVILKTIIHRAELADGLGGQSLLATQLGQFLRLTHFWADGGYKKPFSDWVAEHLGWSVQIVKRARKREGVMDGLARLMMTEGECDRVYGEGFHAPLSLDCRAHLCLLQYVTSFEQGLLTTARDDSSPSLCRYGTPVASALISVEFLAVLFQNGPSIV